MPCLDSSFIIDYWEGEYVAAGYLNNLADSEPIFVPTVVLYELYTGALRSNAPTEDIETVAADLDWTTPLPFGDGPAREAAAIRVALRERGEQINAADLLIAGTARDADMTLVTTDSDFNRVPDLQVDNPSQSASDEPEDADE